MDGGWGGGSELENSGGMWMRKGNEISDYDW